MSEIRYPTRLSRSPIHGKGVFSEGKIPARKKIGSMGGTLISERAANRKAKRLRVISMVELGNGKTLDGSINGNHLARVNHSCKPNSYIRVIGCEVEFYALRQISKGEEITCSYGVSYHGGKKYCRCGVRGCLGVL